MNHFPVSVQTKKRREYRTYRPLYVGLRKTGNLVQWVPGGTQRKVRSTNHSRVHGDPVDS